MVLRYIARRLVELVPVVFFITLVVFLMMKSIPGDPVRVFLGLTSEEAATVISPEVYEYVRRQLGLDQPVIVQYFRWLWNLMRGDFGLSLITRQPVLDEILRGLPASIYLAFLSLILGCLIAIPLGIIAALRRNTIIDYLCNGFAIFGISIPNFWFGLLLILLFSIKLQALPSMGYVSPLEDLWGFLKFAIMPAIALGTHLAAQVTRFTRTDVLDQLRQDYVRTARAKGLPERLVIYKHVVKNSLMSTVTALGLQVAHLLGGSTVIETLFSWPGLARMLINSIYSRDYPMVQGTVIFLALITVLTNLVVDVMYKFLDPRVRLGG